MIINISNNNLDVFGGLAKIVNGILEYGKFKIRITQENKESLYHLIRKGVLTSQEKTNKLIDVIFGKYENGEFIASMQLIKILEYMDDELLDAILNVKIHSGSDKYFLDCDIYDNTDAGILFTRGLLNSVSHTINGGYTLCKEIMQIRDLCNSSNV